jgi:hypothetical protein
MSGSALIRTYENPERPLAFLLRLSCAFRWIRCALLKGSKASPHSTAQRALQLPHDDMGNRSPVSFSSEPPESSMHFPVRAPCHSASATQGRFFPRAWVVQCSPRISPPPHLARAGCTYTHRRPEREYFLPSDECRLTTQRVGDFGRIQRQNSGDALSRICRW